MSGRIEARLRGLGIALPEPAAPLANYVPFTVGGGLVLVSGQVPVREGRIAYTGKLGAGVPRLSGRQSPSAGCGRSRRPR